MKASKILLGVTLFGFLSGCGGGGGGESDNPAKAADVTVSADPRSIDSGDRTLVTIYVSDVNQLGILLKVRFPKEMEYVKHSATMEVDGVSHEVKADFDAADDSNTYVVFILDRYQFGDNNQGIVTLQGQATAKSTTPLIEVDPDINDPLVKDKDEFDVTNPEFAAEDSVAIEIAG